ncbi:MAG TPA: NAD-dependent succinate-semialdehyde dehydrogenase [Vicinamibacteria bacterium]|nr:NAD-dependent succinate-semialdehyde dehydrogenase [Vicinamibacteria bacterium]
MSLRSVNPMDGELLREYPEASDQELRHALLEASCAFAGWRTIPFPARAQKMRAAADRLEARQDELARLMALEMGKPLAQGRAEIEKCAATCRFYADNAERFLSDEPVETDAAKSFVAYNPLGTVLAVMPWNFPFWQVFRFAAPALMAGNVGILKHASNVTGCALAIQEIFREAGFPEPAFRAVLVGSARVGSLIEAPEVKAVTLTGSTPAGQSVAARAGAVLKKTVLELGGSDPYVVLEDADLEAAAETCVTSRLINSGQSCIAAKRFIVVEPVRGRFEELFVEKMRARRMGDPLEPGVDLGPLARRDLRDSVHEQVERSVRAGARVLLGGKPADGRGAVYPPTVLGGVGKGMAAFDEEVFGPVAAIVPARDEDEAVRLANDTPFGLGAAVFTRDVARGERIAARALEAGNCFVNALVRSDPRLPFGGVKASGYGRELSHFGIREFVNVKTVYVK